MNYKLKHKLQFTFYFIQIKVDFAECVCAYIDAHTWTQWLLYTASILHLHYSLDIYTNNSVKLFISV